jgi:poly(hydroxyalkanoate) granule-associated protein
MAKKKKDRLDELKTSAQKVRLAGLGALSEAEKQGDKLFKTLVKKGKKYENVFHEPVEMARDAVDKAKKRTNKAIKDVETAFDTQVAAAMRRLDVANRYEVEALRNEISRLKSAKKKTKKKS